VTEPLYNVVAANLTDYSERLIATGKTEAAAEGIVSMCVARLGCNKEIFKAVPQEPKP